MRVRWWEIARAAFAFLAIGAAAWFGIRYGADAFIAAGSKLQTMATVFQVAYGLSAFWALGWLIRRDRRIVTPLALWTLTMSTTAMLAARGWGGSTWIAAALAGLVTAVINSLISWAAVAHVRRFPKRAAPIDNT